MSSVGPRPRRVAVALSGGVDSSVAAALLLREGLDLFGVTMLVWSASSTGEPPASAAHDARLVCDRLGIPLHVVDLREQFKSQVVDAFCASYERGWTPNPCLTCNRQIKFGALFNAALELGADHFATGHYARIDCLEGEYRLLRARDRHKDQAYVLYTLGQDDLRRTRFPVGSLTKEQVRAMADDLGLPNAHRPESQDACFLARTDYRQLVAHLRPDTARPGPILDVAGKVIGQHQGIAFYTVGQRQGLGIYGAAPSFVLEIDAARNALVVGAKSALYRGSLLAHQVSFVSGRPPPGPVAIQAKIRYNAAEQPATLEALPNQTARVTFDSPQPAITPGQGVVFYQDDLVLGGGLILAPGPREG